MDAEKSYIMCSPRSLQLAVTRVGQFPTCIPHGNKALNLFSWKQLVVSQIQMPTCVLTANLLDERWISGFIIIIIRNTLPRVKQGGLLVLFCFCSFGWVQKGRTSQAELQCCRQIRVGAGWAKNAPFWCIWSPGTWCPGTEQAQLSSTA